MTLPYSLSGFPRTYRRCRPNDIESSSFRNSILLRIWKSELYSFHPSCLTIGNYTIFPQITGRLSGHFRRQNYWKKRKITTYRPDFRILIPDKDTNSFFYRGCVRKYEGIRSIGNWLLWGVYNRLQWNCLLGGWSGLRKIRCNWSWIPGSGVARGYKPGLLYWNPSNYAFFLCLVNPVEEIYFHIFRVTVPKRCICWNSVFHGYNFREFPIGKRYFFLCWNSLSRSMKVLPMSIL